MRRAMRDHSATGTVQKFKRRAGDLVGSDGQQPGVRLVAVRQRGWTGGVSQDDALRSEWAVARGIGRSEKRDHRDVESGCQVQGTGVSADEEPERAA